MLVTLVTYSGVLVWCLVFGVSVAVCDCCLFLLRMTDDVSDDHTHTTKIQSGAAEAILNERMKRKFW